MTQPGTVALFAALVLGSSLSASAQSTTGFVAAGVNRDLNGAQVFGINAGAVTDLAHAWIAVGGHGDLFVSNGYLGGRLTGLTQVNVVRRPHLRVFTLGGLSLGVMDGPLFGVGLEARGPRSRLGFRIALEDHLARVSGVDCGFFGIPQAECHARFHGGQSYTVHQLSLQLGVTWHRAASRKRDRAANSIGRR